jgi:hypothetical protein
MEIDYENLIRKVKKQKYEKLFEQKPFLTLHPLERMWWIRYHKLKVAAQKTGWKEKFPEFHDGPIVDRPWFKLDHWINLELNVIQRYVERECFDWEHLQDYRVDVVFCERDLGEGCGDCVHGLICDLRVR